MTLRRTMAVAVLSLAVAGLGACGGDDDDDSAAADIEKYCELSEKLNDEFENFEEPETEEELVAAMKKLYEDNEDTFTDLAEVVPEEIKADFDKGVAAIKAAGEGDIEKLSDIDDTSAMDEFDEKNCK